MSVNYGYTKIRVLLDPENSGLLADGGRLQDVCVIPTDPHGGAGASAAAGIALLACQARELAFELLSVAEHADRQRTHP